MWVRLRLRLPNMKRKGTLFKHIYAPCGTTGRKSCTITELALPLSHASVLPRNRETNEKT